MAQEIAHQQQPRMPRTLGHHLTSASGPKIVICVIVSLLAREGLLAGVGAVVLLLLLYAGWRYRFLPFKQAHSHSHAHGECDRCHPQQASPQPVPGPSNRQPARAGGTPPPWPSVKCWGCPLTIRLEGRSWSENRGRPTVR